MWTVETSGYLWMVAVVAVHWSSCMEEEGNHGATANLQPKRPVRPAIIIYTWREPGTIIRSLLSCLPALASIAVSRVCLRQKWSTWCWWFLHGQGVLLRRLVGGGPDFMYARKWYLLGGPQPLWQRWSSLARVGGGVAAPPVHRSPAAPDRPPSSPEAGRLPGRQQASFGFWTLLLPHT